MTLKLFTMSRKHIEMLKLEMRVVFGYLFFLLFILLLSTFISCDSGWTLLGWEVK